MHVIRQKLKPVWHQTGYVDRGRSLLVAETPQNLLVRLKGKRAVMTLPWGVIYVKAAQVTAQLDRIRKLNERKAAKSAKRKGR